jgi:phage-related protein (TIGR01555 family)
MVLGQSRVQTIIDAIMNVDAAENGFAALIKDARNRRIYIPKLLEQVATAEGEAILAKRLQAFALGESSNSVSWLDGGDGEGKGAEKIEDRQMNWAGMPDIMASYRTAAAAASEMPGTVMWGTSPQGMNATGDSDIQLWHKTINGKQDLDLRPRMTKIDAVLIPSALGRSMIRSGMTGRLCPSSRKRMRQQPLELVAGVADRAKQWTGPRCGAVQGRAKHHRRAWLVAGPWRCSG